MMYQISITYESAKCVFHFPVIPTELTSLYHNGLTEILKLVLSVSFILNLREMFSKI
jgi:hypothetical protein